MFSRILALFSLLFLFTSAGPALAGEIDPDQVTLDSSRQRVTEIPTRIWHKIKDPQGGGVPVILRSYQGQNVFWFESRSTGSSKERSEIRVRANNFEFGEWKYLKFDFFLSASADNGEDGEWNIITQVAQQYVVTDSQPAKSPPLSFQVLNGRLYIKTIQSFQTWSSGSPKWYPMIDLGPVVPGRWHSVWARVKMGNDGGVVARVDRGGLVSAYRPIGYKDHRYLGRYTASARFGIYRKSSPSTVGRLTRILFSTFNISDSYIRP